MEKLKKKKNNFYKNLKKGGGEIDFLIGTHLLFQKKTTIFKNFRYIVIDEQHKFGARSC